MEASTRKDNSMSTNYFKSGYYNVICDVCGRKLKSDEVRKRWDGFYVCPEDFETRHPLDFLKVPSTEKAIPWSRPEPADIFIVPDYIATTIGNQDTTVPSGTYTPEEPSL